MSYCTRPSIVVVSLFTLALAACGDSGGSGGSAAGGSAQGGNPATGGGGAATTDGGGGATTGDTVCSCNPSSTFNAECQSFEGPAGGTIVTYCASHKTNCAAIGGTYADAACPTANALGECSEDPGKFPPEITFRRVAYSGPPSNFATADDAKAGLMCDPPKTWTAY